LPTSESIKQALLLLLTARARDDVEECISRQSRNFAYMQKLLQPEPTLLFDLHLISFHFFALITISSSTRSLAGLLLLLSVQQTNIQTYKQTNKQTK